MKLKTTVLGGLILLNCLISLICCHAQDDWLLVKNQHNIRLWTKKLAGTALLQFKAETYVNAELKELYQIMTDVENMHTWYDKVKNVSILKKNSETEGIYLLEYKLPLPFENRISTLKGNIFLDNANGIIKVKTVYQPYSIPEKYKSLTLISQISSNWDIEQTKDGLLKIIHSGYLNPGGNIPLWMANESITTSPLKSLLNLKKLLKN